jgi:glucose/mannose transport system permease protein
MSVSAEIATPTNQAAKVEPYGARPKRVTMGRVGLYLFLVGSAAFFAIPLYIMVITSLKTMPEIRLGNIFSWPESVNLAAWARAWDTACTGLECGGIKVGFWNSVKIVVPSVVVSIAVAAWTGYALSFWRPRGAQLLFGFLLVGAFIPYQVFLYPMVRLFSAVGLYGTLPGIVIIHTVFGLPILMLLFRNFYVGLPVELFKAARVDGANYFQVFWFVMLPLSTPILIVAVIMQSASIWNDFLFGLVFAGEPNKPMTVQLNNIVGSTFGEKEYNVNMAATLLTALVPLAIYFVSGRWFVRGIAAGAVKG